MVARTEAPVWRQNLGTVKLNLPTSEGTTCRIIYMLKFISQKMQVRILQVCKDCSKKYLLTTYMEQMHIYDMMTRNEKHRIFLTTNGFGTGKARVQKQMIGYLANSIRQNFALPTCISIKQIHISTVHGGNNITTSTFWRRVRRISLACPGKPGNASAADD